MLNVFESNAVRLRELHAAVNATCKKRDEGVRQRQAWKPLVGASTSRLTVWLFREVSGKGCNPQSGQPGILGNGG
jgi:hypothetical protein